MPIETVFVKDVQPLSLTDCMTQCTPGTVFPKVRVFDNGSVIPKLVGQCFPGNNATVRISHREFAALVAFPKSKGTRLDINYEGNSVRKVTVTPPRSMGIDFHAGPISGHAWLTASGSWLLPQIRFNFELVLFRLRRIGVTFDSTAVEDATASDAITVEAEQPEGAAQANGASESKVREAIAAPAPS